MKKKSGGILGRTALILMIAALAGCKSGQEEEQPTSKEPESEAALEAKPEAEPKDEPEACAPLGLSTFRGSQSDWDENTWEQLYNVRWQKIYLEAQDAVTYPELAAWLENMGREREAAAAEAVENLQETVADLQEIEDMDGYAMHSLEDRQEISVIRADSRCLSLLEFLREDSGGAHGNYGYNGYALDPESGRPMKLEEVITDMEKLPKMIAEKLEAGYPDTSFFAPPEEMVEQYLEEEKLNWVLTQQGILFLFSPYELASYADGALFAGISFEEEPDLFSPRYREIPKRYTVQLQMMTPFLFDLDDDGSFEELCVSNTYHEEEGAYVELHITVDGRECTEEIYAFDIQLYLVHDTLKKRTWLYAQTSENNDYRTIFVYELYPDGEKAAEQIGQLSGWGFHTLFTGETDYREEIFTDTAHFLLESRTELLSTLLGAKEYFVDETGMPRTESEYLTVENGIELTSKVPLTLEIPDGDKKEETFPAGTVFVYYRTDNETFVDLKTGDGKICRLRPEKRDYQLFIDGLEQYEVFDGLIYAG